MKSIHSLMFRFIPLVLLLLQSIPAAATVVVNDEPLSQEVLGSLEHQFQIRISDGRYWYDPMCGAWGLESGPTLGFTLPGYPLGGELQTSASGGSGAGTLTGVFVNGRELHPTDVHQLSQLITVLPGRYWMDHAGNAGYENGPALVNLWRIADQLGRGGKAYQQRTAGGYIGGDGDTWYFFDPKTGSSVMN